MTTTEPSPSATGFSRRWIVVKLYVNGVALAGLGILFAAVFLQAGLRLGPDQLAEFVIGALVVAPVVLGLLLSIGLMVFIRLYLTVGRIQREGLAGPSPAAEAWELINRFPGRAMLLSMSSWVIGTPLVGLWLVYRDALPRGEVLIAVVCSTLLGMTTSVGFYLRARSVFKPVLDFVSRGLPADFELSRRTSISFKLFLAYAFIWFAITLSLGVEAYFWMQRAERDAALDIAADRIAAMNREGKVTPPEDLGTFTLRPFLVNYQGALIDGATLGEADRELIRTSHRLLGMSEWRQSGRVHVSVTDLLSRWVPLPEAALAPPPPAPPPEPNASGTAPAEAAEAAAPPRWIVVSREPLAKGLHAGAELSFKPLTPAKTQARRRVIFLLALFWATSLLLVVLYSTWLARDVGGGIRGLKSAIDRAIRQRKFTTLPISGDDEVGELAAAFNRMNRELQGRLQERENSVSAITGAAVNLTQVMEHLAAISSEQASDASEQAVSMHEISTTSEQIAATLRVIAENAQSVEEVAGQSLSACRTGQTQLQEVIESMDATSSRAQEVAQRMLNLQEQANRIEGILNFIQDISEKTNLIALNASIEASGAGEAGQRFSIIAQEMRKLAEKTMGGTREIQGLFSDLQAATGKAIIATEEGEKKVAQARALSDKASEAFQNIVHWAGETARSAHEIAISSSQQTTATDHLASALGEIKEVVARFAERSKAIETSTLELENIGSELKTPRGLEETRRPGREDAIMTNNELSRQVLELLIEKEGSLRFKDLVGVLGIDARALFKNLFFLEEKGFVSLATSYPNDVVYPQIHLVRLRKAGESLARDPGRLDQAFPLSDTSADTLLHIPPDLGGRRSLTFARALELLAARLRGSLQGEECDAALEKVESLLGLPFIHEPVPITDLPPK